MDLYPNPTTTKSPDDSEFDTPPHTQPLHPFLSFTKNHHHHHHLSPSVVVVTYKECLKNHAASLGGHAMDGCGEFMPSPSATAGDPTSLKCAACGCHRNFHRREPNDPSPTSIIPPLFEFHYPSLPRRASPSPSPPPPPPPPPPNMLLALSMAVPDDHHRQSPATPTEFKTENQTGRKRVRTKFSQEQKEKMQSFSEKLGWKMQKCDESKVEEFCNEIGVSRGVLKIWMHNNKNNFAKKEINTGRFISFENNGQKINGDKGCDNKNSNYVQIHVSNNGSSSSSYSSDKSRYN